MDNNINKLTKQKPIQNKNSVTTQSIPQIKSNVSSEAQNALKNIIQSGSTNYFDQKNYDNIHVVIIVLSDITEPDKKILFCKEILLQGKLHEDIKKHLLKEFVPLLDDLPYNKKKEFIDFAVKNFGENNLYDTNGQKKQDLRKLNDYKNYLNLDVNDYTAGEKKIFLVGGGHSKIQKDLPSAYITNCDKREIEDNQDIATKIITQDFCTDDFKNVVNLSTHQDEIWALYSLPMYATSLENVENFFINSLDILDNNGKLRVFPKDGFYTGAAINAAYKLISPDLKLFEDKILEAIRSKPDLFTLDIFQRIPTGGLDRTFKKEGYIITLKDKERASEYLKQKMPSIKQDVINQSSRSIEKNKNEIDVEIEVIIPNLATFYPPYP